MEMSNKEVIEFKYLNLIYKADKTQVPAVRIEPQDFQLVKEIFGDGIGYRISQNHKFLYWEKK